ncbi:MAG TPA: hypothetical protein VK879_07110 [Candidatus Sulfomarinibacteraceae bacterium]|nr:hypothetical protein [Candidatus Sulfomarinibacteraceae bacterium]
MTLEGHRFRWAWTVALLCFVIAGSTGALLRFGTLWGFPAGLHLFNVRHAHSHLMYFGWVTPALMALIASRLPQMGARTTDAAFNRVLRALFAAALLAYIPFLLFGYQPVSIGDANIPLAMIGAAANVLVWYAFVWSYVRATSHLRRSTPLRLWDASLVFLVLASLGAWGLALGGILSVDSPLLSLALTHVFLDLFADGWFVLALLGLVFGAFPQSAGSRAAYWGENLLVIGLPLTFLLSLPATALPPTVRILAGLSGALVAAGLFTILYALLPAAYRQRRWRWIPPLAFLGLKALAELVISFPAGALWANQLALRISYLHWLLLGFVTLGLAAAAIDRWGPAAARGNAWLVASVILVLLTLIPLTRLWPPSLAGRWALEAAAWATLGPVLVALFMCAMLLKGNDAHLWPINKKRARELQPQPTE